MFLFFSVGMLGFCNSQSQIEGLVWFGSFWCLDSFFCSPWPRAMISITRILLILIVVACGLTILVSFNHTFQMAKLVPSHVHGGQSTLDTGTMSRLMEFPTAMKNVERSLLALEQHIHDLDEEMKGGRSPPKKDDASVGEPRDASGSVGGVLAASGSSGSAASTAGAGRPEAANQREQRWRKDRRCGSNASPLPDGKVAECDPTGDFACCSALGWCGGSKQHCLCKGCVNYKEKYAKELGQSVASLPPMPPKDGHKGKTVVVIIPFRDRESHLKLFKQYWRWFSEHGRIPKTVQHWVVFVAEQFDSETFNRGWNFNGALAIASALTTASPDAWKCRLNMVFAFGVWLLWPQVYAPNIPKPFGRGTL